MQPKMNQSPFTIGKKATSASSIEVTEEGGVPIDVIEVWHPADLPQLELRRGFGVARPVPRHWHEEYQFCLIQSGPSELEYRGTSFPTPPASLFMVHPGEVHSNRAHHSSGCSYRTLFVDGELMRSAASEVFGKESSSLPFLPTAVTSDTVVVGKYLNLHFAMEQSSSRLEREGLLMDLLATVISRFAENRPASQSLGRERRAVKLARTYLIEHYAENITLTDLARIARLSPFHFSRVFAEAFGMPPHAFQTQLRVSHAKALLRLGRTISDVACETGFADQSHLNRHFKRLVEPSPGRYRSGSKNVQYI
jgi:AraC-like DNA-binding protein